MEDPNGSDEQGHFDRIARAVQQGNVPVLRNVYRRGLYRATRRDHRGLWLASGEGTSAEKLLLMPENATDWFIDGQPRVSSVKGCGLAYERLYNGLVRGNPVLSRNLRLSDSVICLAGLPVGESATRNAYDAVHLRVAAEAASLPELLSVHGWHPEGVSRLRYYNPRTKCLDREGPLPELIVADGIRAFLAIQTHEECAGASIIVVAPRTADHDQLEELRRCIGTLTQWYAPADASAVLAPASGVSALLLVQKE
jgi:hypothetical protein